MHVASLTLYGNLTDEKGVSIHQFERTVSLKMDPETFRDVLGRPFSFQDTFPVVEGRYRLNLLMKNAVGKEFSSVASEVETEGTEGRKTGARIILGYDSKESGGASPKYRAFRFGDLQFYPTARKEFIRKDTLHMLLLRTDPATDREKVRNIEFSISLSGKEIRKITKKITDYPRADAVVEKVPLQDFSAGIYDVRVTLTDAAGMPLEKISDRFTVNFGDQNSTPWIISYYDRTFGPASRLRILGKELLNLGKPDAALAVLQDASRLEPSSAAILLTLADDLVKLSRYEEAVRALEPLKGKAEEQPELYYALARALHGAGRYHEAVQELLAYTKHESSNIYALNLLGDCYRRLGNTGEALKVYETSLKLAAGQEDIKALVEKLRESK
jgi:tetratricopeptide (TPR) repeat protein